MQRGWALRGGARGAANGHDVLPLERSILAESRVVARCRRIVASRSRARIPSLGARERPVIDRRSLLRAAGIITAGALVDCVAPPIASSPSPSPSPVATPPTASPTARTADWSALARSLRGTLVRPGDAGYDAARILYNTRFDGIRPQGVAR